MVGIKVNSTPNHHYFTGLKLHATAFTNSDSFSHHFYAITKVLDCRQQTTVDTGHSKCVNMLHVFSGKSLLRQSKTKSDDVNPTVKKVKLSHYMLSRHLGGEET
ncbi:hypothetical protein L798_06178 [Zootermopsis nevadensis]|uniref:Uncharacterized protein n=1 Tax=Zootermopsis nevadensis TaxID=136037 RepID=A0A067R7Z0_ZOONE|nr:hypothetical protein L798_06178 [Zootermopsis nevadensis]